VNGYYDKDPLTLKNSFKEHKNLLLAPLDKRIINPDEAFNHSIQNKLYKPNEELLLEIDKA
jgi:hypothetical protein